MNQGYKVKSHLSSHRNKYSYRAKNNSGRKDKKIRVLIIATLVSLLLILIFSPLNVLFNKMFLIEYLRANQCCVIVPFIITYTILTILGIPGTLLTLAGGVVFGIWWGTLWSVIGATLGALGAFWTARYLLRDYIKHKFGRHKALKKFNQAVQNKPNSFVLAVRFAPISPFNVVNFLFGLTPIHWLNYTIATFFGIIPGTLAYTWLGTSGAEALEGGDRTPFLLALSLLTLLSLIPLYKKHQNNN